MIEFSSGLADGFIARLQDKETSDFILSVASPILWCVLFVTIMDRDSLLETWYMPLLGFLAAFLANSVPIGGGIVYIPALSLLGAQISLGCSFTLATMTIGNGIFGFLWWLAKDSSVMVWESFPRTVLPSYAGSLLAMLLLPQPAIAIIKQCFACFCFVLGIIVLLAIYRGGLNKILPFQCVALTKLPSTSIIEAEARMLLVIDGIEDVTGRKSVGLDKAEAMASIFDSTTLPTLPSPTAEQWHLVSSVSFIGGVLLVPNIGIGPALVTYVMLSLLGYREDQAMVSGIVTGGWVCALPFAFHVLVWNDVPYHLWVMVLPGVFLGAKVSYTSLVAFRWLLANWRCAGWLCWMAALVRAAPDRLDREAEHHAGLCAVPLCLCAALLAALGCWPLAAPECRSIAATGYRTVHIATAAAHRCCTRALSEVSHPATPGDQHLRGSCPIALTCVHILLKTVR
jgi:uncharacterized membrane protein YfcA